MLTNSQLACMFFQLRLGGPAGVTYVLSEKSLISSSNDEPDDKQYSFRFDLSVIL